MELQVTIVEAEMCPDHVHMVRGIRLFLSAKFDITKHPRYKYLSDADKKNAFDVEKYLVRLRKPRPPVAPDEPFDFYEIEDEPGTDAIGEIETESGV